MRILFVTTNLPVPVNSGNAVRTFSTIRALAEAGHAVDFVSFAYGPPSDLQPLAPWCRAVVTVEQSPVNQAHGLDYFGRLAMFLSGKSFAIERYVSAIMRSRIEDTLKHTAYDCILADHVYALVNVPETTVPIVLNCPNVESLLLERYARLEKNPLKRLYAQAEAKRMEAAERRACARSALALPCSEHDGAKLRTFRADLPIFVVPNCVDTGYFAPENSRPPATVSTLLFQGVMDWFPNQDAVTFFARDILPEIRRAVPEVRFLIAGRNPPQGFRRQFAAVSNLEFTGTVPDMRPYLAQASVVVVPLRIGSGTRIKILEAAAAGKAVVSTHLGAEGLALEHHREIVLADDPRAFADEVTALLRKPERCRELGRAAREKVVARYSQKALTQILQSALHALGEKPREHHGRD